MAGQDLRSFVAAYERAHPGEVIRVTDQVSLEEDVMALVLEYERRRRYPILLFENAGGQDISIVCHVVASRGALAFALGVGERDLAAEYARRIKDYVKPVVVPDPPFRNRILTGPALDLTRLPIPRYFPGDAGRYLTAGMLVARDPDTGVETEGYHRFQLKGRDRMGVSLHSRRRMFEYQRRAEAKGQALPCAIVLGLHPLISMGSLAYPPADVGKFEVVGGLLGEPLQVAPCRAIDLHVPAAAEIVIEGEILPGVREPEGPFGEFTGYASYRSTEHVFVAHRVRMRRDAMFQSVTSGMSRDHILVSCITREGEILNALGRVIPIVRGVDHYLKLVVVVDDDIDVFDESEVLWAIATRMQADRDLVVIAGSLGATLDPSADERGVTAKLGIDATRPFGEPFAEKLVMPPERMAWARELVDRLAR